MIVVAIIGILAAIAIPNFLRFQAKSKQSEAKTNLGGIFTAETAYFAKTTGTEPRHRIAGRRSGRPTGYTLLHGRPGPTWVCTTTAARRMGVRHPGDFGRHSARLHGRRAGTGRLGCGSRQWVMDDVRNLRNSFDDVIA